MIFPPKISAFIFCYNKLNFPVLTCIYNCIHISKCVIIYTNNEAKYSFLIRNLFSFFEEDLTPTDTIAYPHGN